ncbi:5,10-methylenetetrahydrofolate reductase [Maioricimonas rarisocia]|uniref:Methylenetetrahydrofolate reductase n=1 Tax=Maioricimonas rarisocia TaxID=2528026 RepID=A0A517ZE64_9PLAN|nr:methylenetetrahydrofolate reductase [NAD(P)H] [Maioricimonas rarisocia]QDU40754.1 5,10-methylenetetrahydrofolate reductase [Maioricimonas rarisocia]
MRIPEIYREGQFGLSIEIFPPKSEQGDRVLWSTLERLRGYAPAFISCTYGAGGTTRTRTVEICREIHERFELTTTAHFTCVGATREELIDWLKYASENGIGNIMALRGDAPQGQESFETPPGGLCYANELVSLIRENVPDVGIGVAGYPEKHPEAATAEIDLANLKRKVDAGADAVFTQLFFDNSNFFRFRDAYQAAGITVPLIPGIMPITEFARIKRITAMCGAVFPTELASRLEAVQDDAEAQFEIGVEYAISQCRELVDAGVPGMHFYVLNKSQACERILDSLGLATPVA